MTIFGADKISGAPNENNPTVADLTATGALDSGYVVAPSGARLASLKDGEVRFINSEPLSEDEFSFKMDKSNVGRKTFDALGREVAYPGYTGGGPCIPGYCPGGYNPPGGFDGTAILSARRNQQRWEDSVFWNLSSYVRQGAIVSQSPPAGWDPYQDNLNRISAERVFVPDWAAGYGRYSEYSALVPGSFAFGDDPVPHVTEIWQKKPEISECDKYLAKLFGDSGSYYAQDWDYAGENYVTKDGYANWRGRYWAGP